MLGSDSVVQTVDSVLPTVESVIQTVGSVLSTVESVVQTVEPVHETVESASDRLQQLRPVQTPFSSLTRALTHPSPAFPAALSREIAECGAVSRDLEQPFPARVLPSSDLTRPYAEIF